MPGSGSAIDFGSDKTSTLPNYHLNMQYHTFGAPRPQDAGFVEKKRRQQINRRTWIIVMLGGLFTVLTTSSLYWGLGLAHLRGGLGLTHHKGDSLGQEGFPEERHDPLFNWFDVKPFPEMVYHPCFNGYECARLEAPMDYHRTDGKGKKVAIAITRLPAKVPVTDPRYGGPVLINPGGPGGSGVSQVLRNGKATQIIVDSALTPNETIHDEEGVHKYHDIIGFDPRGVSRTTPAIACFPDSPTRDMWQLQNEASGLLGSSEDSFYRNWYRSRALAQGCSKSTGTTFDGTEPVGEHVNTVPVARDMLEIVERHAEWLSKEGQKAQVDSDMMTGYDSTRAIEKRTAWHRNATKLQYWGNSYGTVLGQTFASLFPSRVQRMVLDGVCDTQDYYFGTWFTNLIDADKILSRFFLYCTDAGPSRCSFFATGGPDAIRTAYEDLLLDIFRVPLAVPSSATRGPDVITWSDVKSMVRLGMYQPLIYLPMVADLLTDIRSGNGSLFADYKAMEHLPSCPSAACQDAGPYSQECIGVGENGLDAQFATLCTDGEGLGDLDEVSFQEYWHALQQQSRVLGDWWAHTRLGCVGWKTKAKWRFAGPFEGNTSWPILFIGNTLDPVTPLNK